MSYRRDRVSWISGGGGVGGRGEKKTAYGLAPEYEDDADWD